MSIKIFDVEESRGKEAADKKATSIQPALYNNLIERTTIAGVPFSNLTMQQAVDEIDKIARAGAAEHVCTGNVDHLYLLQKDKEFQRAYATARLVLVDGMPIVWLSRLALGQKNLKERVAGSDLFWELAKRSHESGLKLFFLGGLPGSAERAQERVLERYPRAQICGVWCPPHDTFASEETQEEIVQRVQQARPDVLLVGFGAPKQEKWIAANKGRLGIGVSIGVGGTFEMAAGAVRRAPSWVCRMGLEWGWRLLQDPRRLCRRYLVNDLPFLVRLTLRTAFGVSSG
jgi:N-acetylglucosaminyldiphosphoundecaprenol N-acetyl-beta-D-mannosaminyltransferase